MFSKSFEIVEKDKFRSNFKIGLFLIVIPLIISALIFIPKEVDNLYAKIYPYIFIFWLLLNIISNFFIKSFKTVGDVYFRDDSVIIKMNKVLLKDVKRILVKMGSYYGESPGSAVYGVGGLSIKEGTDNRIVVLTNNGERFEFFVWVHYFREFKTLEKILRHYHKNGIEVSLKNKRNKII